MKFQYVAPTYEIAENHYLHTRTLAGGQYLDLI